jgi:mono/diheme cytochrome c family protein
MRSLVAMFLLIAVLLYVTPLLAADAAAGKDLFGKKCASCHGASGEGKDSVAKMLKVEFKHLGSKEVQAKSDVDLTKVILEGVGKMKGVKDVDAKAADDVVAYMRTLKK